MNKKNINNLLSCFQMNENINSIKNNIHNIVYNELYGFYGDIRDKCVYGKNTIAKDQNQYPYIPLGYNKFNAILTYIQNTYGRRQSFIDVGCGVGDKTLFANLSGLFYNTYGIEYDEYSYNIAKDKTSKFMRGRYQFIHGDAFKHSFEPYDTVYLYCPLRTDEMMQKLMNHIYNTINKNVIICFCNANMNIEKWIKGKDVYIDREYGFYIIKK